MAKKRYTPETIIRKLREAEVLQAHTTSQGWIDNGDGTLTFVLGTYHGGAPAEGSVTFNGQSFDFTSTTDSKPSGLVDGVNNFYGKIYCGGILGQYDQPDASCTDTPQR